MGIETREYGEGTALTVSYPWGWNVRRGTRALCSDGKVRSVVRISETADTFFSIPAAVKVNGKTVSGYVTLETLEGWSTPSDVDPTVLKFCRFNHGRNADELPAGPYRRSAQVTK